MKQRTFLRGGAMGVAGLSMAPALAHYQSNGRHPTPEDLGGDLNSGCTRSPRRPLPTPG